MPRHRYYDPDPFDPSVSSRDEPTDADMRAAAVNMCMDDPSLTFDDAYKKIKKRFEHKEIVAVYVYGDGADDFDDDEAFAKYVAGSRGTTDGYAWKKDDGTLVLMSQDEVKAYKKAHPSAKLPPHHHHS